MKIDFNIDITKMVEEIVMQATEKQEEFIFETIRPYCEDILQMKINKKELKQILLKQQSCEDCISRKEVNVLVDELARAISDERCFISRGRSTAAILQDILDLPSVTPQPKTGEWIGIPYFEGDETYYQPKCPFCNTEPKEYSYYCPNCGAKLLEEEPDY